MATEFRLPELGENIETGDLIKVLVSVGDTISQDQPVLELETDKATIEVPSPVGGTVKEIHVREGEKIKVGQLILTVEDGGKPAQPGQREEAKATRSGEVRTDKGEYVPAAKAEATRAPTETVGKGSEPAGAAVSATPAPLRENVAAQELAEEVSVAMRHAVREPEGPRQVAPASPSVRRLARELGVDINRVTGSGLGSRIAPEDVKDYVRRVVTGAGSALGTQAIVSFPDFAKWGEIERIAMGNVRRKTAEHLSYAWATIPQVTQFDKADITALEQLRKRYEKRAEEAGGKLTFTAIALKVAASALRVFPQFCASVDAARNEIIYKKYYHIGVAVDTDRGLLVPVIRHVDRKNILELSVELAHLAEKARNRTIAPEEMEGGVFTITNLGGIGGTNFSPIVNSPEVAILGISRASLEPVFLNGQFEPHLMLPLALSYDHRLIDGAAAARFLRWVAEALEQPFLLPLQG